MGENLVLNMAGRGFTVAVYNRTTSRVDDFIGGRANGTTIIGTHSLEELCARLGKPRRIMLMIKAGTPVDRVIESLLPHLQPGDIIIDGGNSEYRDSDRRTAELAKKQFLWRRVSGGRRRITRPQSCRRNRNLPPNPPSGNCGEQRGERRDWSGRGAALSSRWSTASNTPTCR